MSHLVVPAAGLSSRYALSRPKWLLQHPSGIPMVAAGLEGLKGKFTQATVVALEEHLEEINTDFLISTIENSLRAPVTILRLASRTSSMVETVVAALDFIGAETPFCVKDSDNFLAPKDDDQRLESNFVFVADLKGFPHVQAANKSFVEVTDAGTVSRIVEKEIVSNLINTGFVGFASSSDFIAAARAVIGAREIHISTVISELIRRGELFSAFEAAEYDDWGTLADWLDFKATWGTMFVDLDGVLFSNADPLSIERNWSSYQPISKNVEYLLVRQDSKRVKFVFTTSRSKSLAKKIEAELANLGFRDFEVVAGLPHATRYLINDFAVTNPYPSAISINLPRNSDSLADYFP